ncbi:MAG: sugar transferase [Paracoccaceae bacterium]
MTINFTEFSGQEGSSQAGALRVKPKRGLYGRIGKRVLDIALVAAAAPFVVPVVAALAVAIAADGGKPFYSQMRVGRAGKPFRMWKLRSMVPDADQRFQAYLDENPEARAEWEEKQKLTDDPRITRIGQFIRKSSLDELPQLWNVLTGEMSLVGPRPMMLNQQMLYPSTAYYRLRPGLTGYWQTIGRSKSSFEARALYDTAYDRDLSLATDVRLIYRTIGVVIGGTGC